MAENCINGITAHPHPLSKPHRVGATKPSKRFVAHNHEILLPTSSPHCRELVVPKLA